MNKEILSNREKEDIFSRRNVLKYGLRSMAFLGAEEVLNGASLLQTGVMSLDRLLLGGQTEAKASLLSGGAILPSQEATHRYLKRKIDSGEALSIDLTLLRSGLYYSLIMSGLEPQLANERARYIYKASPSASDCSENSDGCVISPLGNLYAEITNFMLNSTGNLLSDWLRLYSVVCLHEGWHLSVVDVISPTAIEDYGPLGKSISTRNKVGFMSYREGYTNRLLGEMLRSGTTFQLEEFGAELSRLRRGKILVETMFNKYSQAKDVLLSESTYPSLRLPLQQTLDTTNSPLPLDLFEEAHINSFHKISDRAGFYLKIGNRLVKHNSHVGSLTAGELRAIGAIGFTDYIFRDREMSFPAIAAFQNDPVTINSILTLAEKVANKKNVILRGL